jgi:hypothetical protein
MNKQCFGVNVEHLLTKEDVHIFTAQKRSVNRKIIHKNLLKNSDLQRCYGASIGKYSATFRRIVMSSSLEKVVQIKQLLKSRHGATLKSITSYQ